MDAQGRTPRGNRRKRKLTVAPEANTLAGVPNDIADHPAETTVCGDRPQKVEVAKGSRQIVVSLEQAD